MGELLFSTLLVTLVTGTAFAILIPIARELLGGDQ